MMRWFLHQLQFFTQLSCITLHNHFKGVYMCLLFCYNLLIHIQYFAVYYWSDCTLNIIPSSYQYGIDSVKCSWAMLIWLSSIIFYNFRFFMHSLWELVSHNLYFPLALAFWFVLMVISVVMLLMLPTQF